MKKIIKYLTHPREALICLMNKNFFFFLPDKLYLKLKFRLIMGYKLDLNNPQTFNEKLQWLKLYDRKPIYTTMVDKYEAKEYVKKIIGDEYIIKTYGVYNNYEEIDFDALPNQFVIKPTHTSGNVYICTDKLKIDHNMLKKKINKWLKRDYYMLHREWPYKNVKPRIIIEEYLNDEKDNGLKDFKIFMFNGKHAYSLVCSDRKTNLKFTFFDKDNKLIELTQENCLNDKNIKLPTNYEKMLKLAQMVSKGTIESRIDFYNVNGKIYFGEITFFDSAGFGSFNPEKYDLVFGRMLKLPKIKLK